MLVANIRFVNDEGVGIELQAESPAEKTLLDLIFDDKIVQKAVSGNYEVRLPPLVSL